MHVDSDRPRIVGIINCTPDSFSDGGQYAEAQDAIAAGLRMVAEGADWLDVGGESTRPGALPVPPEEQSRRILPVIRGLREATDAPVSVDTMSPAVGESALEAGADIVNDVSACRNPAWESVLGGRDVPVVLMHMKGTPSDMQLNPDYPEGVVAEVLRFFEERVRVLGRWGVQADRIILDPGIGFGKRVKDNLELLRNIDAFRSTGRPVFIGTSRKSFLRKILGEENPDLDLCTVIVNTMAVLNGANFLRVHNVAHASVLVRLLGALRQVEDRHG